MKLIAVLIAAGLACAGAEAKPLELHIAGTATAVDLVPLLLEKKDVFRHLGDSYTVDTVTFAQSATALRAMAAGKIDIATLTPIEFAVAVQNAGLDDLRIIADDYQDGVGRHYSSEFMVREDSNIRAVEDLAGKLVAVTPEGSMLEFGLTTMLRRHGLGPGSYRKVELPAGMLGPMLDGGKVDLAGLPAPFSYALRDRDQPRTLFTLKDALGPTEGLMLAARAPFVAANGAALTDFFEDFIRSLRWFLDPDHHDEAALIAAELAHAPMSLFSDYLFTDGDYYRNPDARPDLAGLQRTVDMLRDAGMLARRIDVASHADLGPVEAAARRLK